MIEIIANCIITSKDLEELANKARKMEQLTKAQIWGMELKFAEWLLADENKIVFYIDQKRAREKGLTNW